jgi:hypothetical protein
MLRTQRKFCLMFDITPSKSDTPQQRCSVHSICDTANALPLQVVQLPPAGPGPWIWIFRAERQVLQKHEPNNIMARNLENVVYPQDLDATVHLG